MKRQLSIYSDTEITQKYSRLGFSAFCSLCLHLLLLILLPMTALQLTDSVLGTNEGLIQVNLSAPAQPDPLNDQVAQPGMSQPAPLSRSTAKGQSRSQVVVSAVAPVQVSEFSTYSVPERVDQDDHPTNYLMAKNASETDRADTNTNPLLVDPTDKPAERTASSSLAASQPDMAIVATTAPTPPVAEFTPVPEPTLLAKQVVSATSAPKVASAPAPILQMQPLLPVPEVQAKSEPIPMPTISATPMPQLEVEATPTPALIASALPTPQVKVEITPEPIPTPSVVATVEPKSVTPVQVTPDVTPAPKVESSPVSIAKSMQNKALPTQVPKASAQPKAMPGEHLATQPVIAATGQSSVPSSSSSAMRQGAAGSAERAVSTASAQGKERVVPDMSTVLAQPSTAPRQLVTRYGDLKPEGERPAKIGMDTPQPDSITRALYSLWETQVRRKIERMGIMNFPRDEHGKSLYGRVRIRIVLNANGTLADSSLVESSGNPALDKAALQVIQYAAVTSFGPVPRPLLDADGQIVLTRSYVFAGDKLGWE